MESLLKTLNWLNWEMSKAWDKDMLRKIYRRYNGYLEIKRMYERGISSKVYEYLVRKSDYMYRCYRKSRGWQ